MSSWLIAAVGCVYAYIAIEQFVQGNVGMGIAYSGYALGNVGLFMLAH